MESASSSKSRKPRHKFTPEFKAEAIKLASEPGQSIAKVAKNLDLTDTALRPWVKQAKIDSGQGSAGALTTAEKHERWSRWVCRQCPASWSIIRCSRRSGVCFLGLILVLVATEGGWGSASRRWILRLFAFI